MQTNKPMVDILLATFNGERYLAQQIKSILAQDYKRIRIVVRDDGSTDGSVVVVRSLIEQHPKRIVLLEDAEGNLGSAMNFMLLLRFATSEYAMFSDQDDVWLPEKVSLTMAAMKKNEDEYGKNTPLLIHTDLIVTNEDLSIISKSFWKYQKIDPKHDKINRLLVQNVVTGCSVMVNRSLLNLVLPVSDGIIEHDWWLALLAASFGRIDYVSRPTLLYRQHDRNVVGAVKWSGWTIFQKFLYRKSRGDFAIKLEKTRIQASRFLKIYGALLPHEVALKMSCYASLDQLNYIAKLVCVFRYRFFKNGMRRNIGMFLSMINALNYDRAAIRDVN